VHTSSEHDHESTSYRDSFLEEDGISEIDQGTSYAPWSFSRVLDTGFDFADAARNSSYLTPTSSIYRLSSQSVPSRRASNLLHARPAHRTSFPRRSSQRLSHLSYQYSSSLKSTSSRTSVLSRSSFYSAPSVSEVYRKSRGSTSEYDEGDEEWEDAPDFDEWDLARESVDFSNPGSRKMSLDQEKVHQDLMASANTQEVLASRLRSSPERDDPLVSPGEFYVSIVSTFCRLSDVPSFPRHSKRCGPAFSIRRERNSDIARSGHRPFFQRCILCGSGFTYLCINIHPNVGDHFLSNNRGHTHLLSSFCRRVF
jgi:hypothetical protein